MTYSEARNKATKKYKKAHYKRVPLELPLEYYDQIKEHAAARNESVNGFIKRAIQEQMKRDS